jgi:chitin synthase
MYLFSTLYSIINLNNISWGVRDEAPEKRVESENETKVDEFKSYKISSRILSYLRSHIISLGSRDDVEEGTSDTCTQVDLFEWTNDDTLKKFSIQELDQEEDLFWKEFIEDYLLPLGKNKIDGKDKAKQLMDLRNTIAFWFGLLNGLFILLVLLIEGNQEYFNYSFNFGSSKNENPEIDKYETKLDGEDVLHIDFIGIVLISVFGSILLIQVFGMLRHRFNTFLILIATTDIWNKKQVRIEVN